METIPDHSAAIAHLRAADPILAEVIAAVGPCELQPTGHGFATLAEAIVSQQISVKAAAAILGRLVAALGELTPAAILEASDEALRAVGLSGQKARYLRDLAAHSEAGTLARLPGLDDEAAIIALTAIKGVGRWTAEIYLLFALGRPDVLPADDLGLRYAAWQFYGLPAAPTPAAVRALAERWRPYRSVAAWYLWRGRRLMGGA
ncbi:MAG: DNA-3-methyladenine glycosylase 2 family protein [Chloroflexales bacterium]|nr:DNA-3-methyladenine glycosylase 2 family protein [Chloroflexales bacterium]